MYSSTNLFPATSSPPNPVSRAAHWFQTSTRPSLSIPKIGAFALRGYHSLHAPPRRRRRAAPLCVSLHVLAHFSRHRRASSLPPVTHATRGLSNEHQGAIDAKWFHDAETRVSINRELSLSWMFRAKRRRPVGGDVAPRRARNRATPSFTSEGSSSCLLYTSPSPRD